jgi:hypothetical protein
MSNTLGTFSVDLVAKIAQFESGWDKAAHIAKKQGEQIRATVAQMGTAIVASVGAAATAVTAIVNQAINTGAMFDDMSQKLGVTAEWLSVMKREAKLGGVELTALQASLVKLDKAAVAAANGSKEQAAAFKAMGISVVDSNGKLKDTGTLFTEVATKMSGYRDGTGKTVLATELLGKTGAELMPMLNGLGEKGFAVARKEAEALGLVMSGPAAAAAGKFQDNLDDMRALLEGFGVQIVNKVIQPLSEYSGKLLDGAKANKDFGGSVDIVATAIKLVIVGASIVKNSIEAVTNVILALYDTTKAVFTAVGQAAGVWGESVAKQMKAVLSFDYDGAVAAGKEGREKLAAVMSGTAAQIKMSWSAAGAGIKESVADVSLAMDLFAEHAAKPGEAAKKAAEEAAKADAPWQAHAASQKSGIDPAEKLAAAQAKLADMLGQERALLGPLAEAKERYAKAERDAIAEADKLRKAGLAEAQVQEYITSAMKQATAERDRSVAAIKRQGDVLGNYLTRLEKDRALLGLTDRQRAVAEAVQRATEEYEQNTRAGIENAQSLEQLRAAVAASEGAFYDQSKAIEAAQAQAKRYGEIVRGAMDSAIDATAAWAVSGFKNAKDYWKSMVDLVKNAVTQMLAEWARTKIMQWFGGGSSSGGGGGFWSSLFGAAVSYVGGSSGGGVSLSQNTANGGIDLSAQQTGGFTYQSGSGSGGGGGWMNYAGNYAMNQGGQYVMANTGGWVAGNAGALGVAGGIAGAAAGAYYGSTRGDGGIGTATGVAAGAIAGYYAGTVAMSAYIGASAGAATGVSGAAAAGAAGGASGAVAAIPIIGWVAAIVLAIDAISGGKALGTRYRPNTLQTDLSFGADGPEATASLTEWKYRRNIFQFNRGGSLEAMRRFGERQYRARDIPIDPELMAAIQQVAEQLDKTAQQAADTLNTKMVDAVEATFQTLQVFDKKGRLKRTETVGTILGKEYKESWEKFQVRMHAETIIATVGQLDSMASAIAEAYRADAETLIDAAAVMLQAQRNLMDKNGLLGAGTNLESTFAWLEQQQRDGEKLSETYARLAQATAQYRDLLTKVDEAIQQVKNGNTPVEQMQAALDQINKTYQQNVDTLNAAAVAAGLTAAAETDLIKLRELQALQTQKLSDQFWNNIDNQIASFTHVATPAGDFALAMDAIAANMNDNIAQATMLARAQGRAGITTEELGKITDLAARQMGAAIKKLQDIAHQQAQSLGYLGPQTVSEIDARISELQGIADAAAESVGGFGGAMAAVAQEATNAINLLLGNLSPLNDQQKLQVALQGLYSGTASQEQVLEIGRRLYASSQAYTDLFNQVMGVRRFAGAGAGGGSRGGGEVRQLTSQEQAELIALREQREAAVRQQRFNEATEFANTIASLASAQGLTFQEVATSIGFDLDKLAKDLGMSQEDLLKYLAGIDVTQTGTTDAVTSGFDRLITWLDTHWGVDDPTYEPNDDDQLPLDALRMEFRAGRDEARNGNRDIVQAIREGNAISREIVDTSRETVAIADPRNTRYTVPRVGGTPR